jgi:hypothetical protein
MAEPFAFSLTGDWQRPSWVPVEASVAHFFEGAVSLCKLVLQEEPWEDVPARSIQGHRCTSCFTLLGQAHTRLEAAAEVARTTEAEPPPSRAEWHEARATHFERKAAATGSRFHKVLFLAEAKGERIKLRREGNPSGFGKVEIGG